MRGRRWLGCRSLLLGLRGVWLAAKWRGVFALWVGVGVAVAFMTLDHHATNDLRGV